MIGKNSGVAQQLLSIESKAIPTHRLAHSWNLGVKDATILD